MTRVERLRPDAYGEEVMTGWLSELDGKYTLAMQGSAQAPYDYPEDRETELFVPHPYDNVYELYLICLIDWHNREMEAYQNDKAMFDAADGDFRAWWTQTYGSAQGAGDGAGGRGRYWKGLLR